MKWIHLTSLLMLATGTLFAQSVTISRPQSLEGTWVATFISEPGAPAIPPVQPLVSLFTFGKDGSVVELNNGVPPPRVIGTPGAGQWVRTGNGEFLLNVIFANALIDAAGNGQHAGFAKQRIQLRFETNADVLSGEMKFSFHDVDGNMLFESRGSYRLERMKWNSLTERPSVP